jgi:hypothetical protein
MAVVAAGIEAGRLQIDRDEARIEQGLDRHVVPRVGQPLPHPRGESPDGEVRTSHTA